MAAPLRVLILEDRPADAELIVAELRRAGFDLDWQRVDNEADFMARLDPSLDIILADYSLPQWDAPRALAAVQARGLDIPFIMISGTVGEDVAVACVKQGAADYLLKDRLGRLGQAVSRALEDKRLRIEKQQAEAALRESHEKLELLFKMLPVGVSVLDRDRRPVKHNPALESILRLSSDALQRGDYRQRKYWRDDGTPMPPEEFPSARVFGGEPLVRDAEVGVETEDGTLIWTRTSAAAFPYTDWSVCIATADISERKRLADKEQDLRILAEALRDTAAALISALNLDAVMNTILDNVARVVPHDAANIMLIEDDHARVVYWRGYPAGYDDALRAFAVPLARADHLRHMSDTRLPFLLPHTDQRPDWIYATHTEWVKSYVAAPIVSNNVTVGFLNVDSGTPGFFTADHAQRLQVFANQTSIAIERAQLYEEIRGYASELEQRVMERTEQLNHSKNRIEAILNSINDVTILCRTDGAVEQVNPAFDATIGLSPDAFFNRPLIDLAIPEHMSLLESAFQTVVQTLHPARLELTVRASGRPAFDADIVLSPVLATNDQLLGVACTLRDITEQKQQEANLRQMLKREMELGEIKSRYVSMAAHDLRNPLAVIQSAISTVRRYRDRLSDDDLEEKYDRMQASINVMVEMLDGILTLGRVESGKLSFEPANMDVGDFCQRLVAETQQATDSAQVIALSLQGSCVGRYADARLLRHILANLLSNAVKFSLDSTEVRFDVDCASDKITFRIQDHGIGIPEGDQKRLFETFFRAGNAQRIPGTGLGLAIVKQSVDLHGGSIAFESQEGRGTAFTVVIPQPSSGKAYEENFGH